MKKKTKTYVCEHIAFHITGHNFKPRYGDEPAWKIGEKRTIQGRVSLCKRGYHSSPTIAGALFHGIAYGSMLCLVVVSTPMQRRWPHNGSRFAKQVSNARRLLVAINWKKVLGRSETNFLMNRAPEQKHVNKLRSALIKELQKHNLGEGWL